MNKFKILLIFIALLFLCSCFDKKPIQTQTRNPGDALFSKAENNFTSGRYEKALKFYSSYLEKYPEQPLAPAAFLKTGAIFSAQNNYETARATYHEMIKKYPQSSYISDAMVEILVTYYKEGRYQDVIEKSYDIPEDIKPNDYIIRKYAIVGDAFLAIRSPVLAVDSFVTAYKKADRSENKGILLRMRKATGQLSDEDVIRLLDTYNNEEIRGYLAYQRCLNAIAKNETDDALRHLNSFLQLFLTHNLTDEAESLKEKLTSKDFDLFLVGCLLPTTGKYASYGSKAQMGFDLAYNDFTVNATNPVTRVIYRDTESDPEKTKAAVRELSELGVAAIIGPVGNVEAAAEEAQLRGIPIITLTGKDNIAETGDYVFRNFLTRKMQIQSIVAYSFEVLGLNSFAILYPDEKYGHDFMNIFWDEIIKYNGDIVGVESYKPLSTDFAKPIRKLTGMHYKYADDPVEESTDEAEGDTTEEPEARVMRPIVDFDALFIPDAGTEVGLILPQLSFYDVGDIYLLGTNLWNNSELIERAGKNANNTIIPDAFFAGSSDRVVQTFVTSFTETFDETPGFIEAVSYDSAMMIFDIIKKGGITTPAEFRDRLIDIKEYHGITGLTGFDETGNAWKELYLLQVKNKRFIERTD